MSPRRPSVNEAMRRRSRERLLQATVELVEERGYEATTLGDIADRAGSARGLVSYYFPGKRLLLQSAAHRLMHCELAAALGREPAPADGREVLARAIDAVLALPVRHPVVMRAHMAGILQAFPRLEMKHEFTDAICVLCATRPQTTYDNFARDFGVRLVPGYQPPSMVDALLGAPFEQ